MEALGFEWWIMINYRYVERRSERAHIALEGKDFDWFVTLNSE
jgi:hypothetical protein